MNNKDLLLTSEQIRAIPFYKNTPDEALPYTLLKAQLAWAKPLIEKQAKREEKERIIRLLDEEYDRCEDTHSDEAQEALMQVKQALQG